MIAPPPARSTDQRFFVFFPWGDVVRTLSLHSLIRASGTNRPWKTSFPIFSHALELARSRLFQLVTYAGHTPDPRVNGDEINGRSPRTVKGGKGIVLTDGFCLFRTRHARCHLGWENGIILERAQGDWNNNSSHWHSTRRRNFDD